MSDGERRDLPTGGRREYDPPAVGLREHLEMLIRGFQVQMEAAMTNLELKLTETATQQSREHRTVLEEVRALASRVDHLEALEDQRTGGKVVLGRGWALFYGVATLAVAVVAVVFAVTFS